MTALFRTLPAITLAMILAISAFGSGFAMAPQRADDGSIVICNGTGLISVSIGSGDTETDYVLLCPDCLPAHIGLAVDPVASAWGVTRISPVRFGQVAHCVIGLDVAEDGQARAPPFT